MPDEIVYGRNSVWEALVAGRRKIHQLVVLASSKDQKIDKIEEAAHKKGILVNRWARKQLDEFCGTDGHQGVVAVISKVQSFELEDILTKSKGKSDPLFFLILDRIEDPRNLGALIRTAEATGVHGLVISKHETCGLTPTVAKASSGAIEYVPVVKVSNVAMVCDKLKKNGVWLFGADPAGQPYWQRDDFNVPLAIVLGSEGKGLKNIIKKKCDFLISLPMKGYISSLNIAIAGAVLMYEVLRQRNL